MQPRLINAAVCGALAASLAACGGSGSSVSDDPSSLGSVPIVLSDAASDDWSLIGVQVLSITLVPQDGGTPVTAWTAPPGTTYVNLEQLDQLGELLGNAQVPVGTYIGAVVTVAANPGDLMLTVASDPESGFTATPSSTIAPANIQIVNPQGSTGSLTVPISVSFDTPLVVTNSTPPNPALDLEFDLS